MEALFPDAIVQVRQFVLGPSTGGKIQLRISGPDPAELRRMSEMTKEIITADPDSLAEAEAICRELVTARGEVLGPDHPHVALKDRAGNQLVAGSTEPYSPRTTCGGCHDFDEVVKGYHFHQGRTDSDGNFIMTDDYFEDGRTFLQSPGMYGKW